MFLNVSFTTNATKIDVLAQERKVSSPALSPMAPVNAVGKTVGKVFGFGNKLKEQEACTVSRQRFRKVLLGAVGTKKDHAVSSTSMQAVGFFEQFRLFFDRNLSQINYSRFVGSILAMIFVGFLMGNMHAVNPDVTGRIPDVMNA